MATMAVAAGASLLSGLIGKGGAKKAAAAQTQAINSGIAEQRRQYDQSRGDFMPFLEAGTGALGQTQDFLGLHGADPQAAAIAMLKASPAFTSLYGTGQDTILQNAAATGGLRGGNTQNSLAQFGSGLLSSVIQNHLQNLGGLVNIGSGTAGQLGQLGQSSAANISNLFTQQGKAQATGIAGQTAAMQSAIGGMGNAFGNFAGARGW
jgi:hypothetical protein